MIIREFFSPSRQDGKTICNSCPLLPRGINIINIQCSAGYTCHLIVFGDETDGTFYSSDCKLLNVTLTMERNDDEEKNKVGCTIK